MKAKGKSSHKDKINKLSKADLTALRGGSDDWYYGGEDSSWNQEQYYQEPVYEEPAYEPPPEPAYEAPAEEPVYYAEPAVEPEYYVQPEPEQYYQPEPEYYEQPEPVYYEQPEPEYYEQPEPVYYEQPEPEYYTQPEPVYYEQPEEYYAQPAVEPEYYVQPEPVYFEQPEEYYVQPEPTPEEYVRFEVPGYEAPAEFYPLPPEEEMWTTQPVPIDDGGWQWEEPIYTTQPVPIDDGGMVWEEPIWITPGENVGIWNPPDDFVIQGPDGEVIDLSGNVWEGPLLDPDMPVWNMNESPEEYNPDIWYGQDVSYGEEFTPQDFQVPSIPVNTEPFDWTQFGTPVELPQPPLPSEQIDFGIIGLPGEVPQDWWTQLPSVPNETVTESSGFVVTETTYQVPVYDQPTPLNEIPANYQPPQEITNWAQLFYAENGRPPTFEDTMARWWDVTGYDAAKTAASVIGGLGLIGIGGTAIAVTSGVTGLISTLDDWTSGVNDFTDAVQLITGSVGVVADLVKLNGLGDAFEVIMAVDDVGDAFSAIVDPINFFAGENGEFGNGQTGPNYGPVMGLNADDIARINEMNGANNTGEPASFEFSLSYTNQGTVDNPFVPGDTLDMANPAENWAYNTGMMYGGDESAINGAESMLNGGAWNQAGAELIAATEISMGNYVNIDVVGNYQTPDTPEADWASQTLQDAYANNPNLSYEDIANDPTLAAAADIINGNYDSTTVYGDDYGWGDDSSYGDDYGWGDDSFYTDDSYFADDSYYSDSFGWDDNVWTDTGWDTGGWSDYDYGWDDSSSWGYDSGYDFGGMDYWGDWGSSGGGGGAWYSDNYDDWAWGWGEGSWGG